MQITSEDRNRLQKVDFEDDVWNLQGKLNAKTSRSRNE